MDNISDVIVLLIMVVATIAGTLFKSKKHVTAIPGSRAEDSHDHDYKSDDMYAEDNFTEDNFGEDILKTANVAYKDPRTIKKASFLKPKSGEDNSEITIYPEQESVADHFDLRTAVIYSEILKPKFDE